MKNREPIAAGSFYPNDKEILKDQVIKYLLKASLKISNNKLRILIVPHAGYSFSGSVAGWGYKQIGKSSMDRIIILGVSHSAFFAGISIWDKGTWQSPLGKVGIDEEFSRALIKKGIVQQNLSVQYQEHSLEVQLPFLQQILENFKIIPILIGQTDIETLENLAENLAENFDKKTILIVSSDLSHYPSYEIAEKVDKATIDGILSGKIEKFEQTIEKGLDQFGVDTCACGADAIKVAMLVVHILGIKEIKLIKYANSADASGDKLRVVGYAAIGFYQ